MSWQIRVSMHMEDPWALHELRFTKSPRTGQFDFVPSTVKNNPTVALFRPDQLASEAAAAAKGALDAEAILDRATTQSCAGCHAPKDLIGEDRSIGCGLVWPDSIGTVHVTEKGELSSALKEVFLPHRAKVLETYLQPCDKGAMFGNFQRGVPDSGQFKVLPACRTLGGGGTH
jgi:hypothetical protein